MRHSLLAALLLSFVLPLAAVQYARGDDAPKKLPRMLMVTQSKGFVHGSVRRPETGLAPAEVAMIQLGKSSEKFTVDCTQDVTADFTKENLQKYDLVFFYTTGNLGIPEETLNYFFNTWLKQKGHGVIGAHSATDTYGDYEPYWDMMGGTFNGHPWNAGETVTISVHEPSHPAVTGLGEEFEIKDEIYQYKHFQPAKVRVLMSLNMAKCKTKMPYHVPVCWVKEYGEGRLFYTNLGHNEGTWANEKFLKHMLGGIEWTLGELKGEGTPNPDVTAAQNEKAKKDVAQ